MLTPKNFFSQKMGWARACGGFILGSAGYAAGIGKRSTTRVHKGCGETIRKPIWDIINLFISHNQEEIPSPVMLWALLVYQLHDTNLCGI